MSEFVRGALFQSPRYYWEYQSARVWVDSSHLMVCGAVVWRKRRRASHAV